MAKKWQNYRHKDSKYEFIYFKFRDSKSKKNQKLFLFWKPLEILADLKKEEDVQRLIDKTIKEFGRLDILVNNAFTTSVHSIRDKNILEHFDNNFGFLRSVIRLVHLSIPYLEKSKGTIINISSVSSIKPVFKLQTISYFIMTLKS